MLERLERFREGNHYQMEKQSSHQATKKMMMPSLIPSLRRETFKVMSYQMRELLTKWCRMVPSNQYRLHTQPSLENWNLRRKDTIW